MTVATTNNRISYTGNGVTTAFSMPYYFLANTDLVVYKGTTLQTLTTHYSVTGAGNPSGGTVTFVTAPASTDTIVIIRDPALTQLVDYIANDTFPAETHERALDLLTMIAQRLADKVGRSIILPDSIVGVNASLPTPAAGAFIGWNANATALASYAGLSNVTISSAMQPVVQANSTLTALGLLGGAASGNNSDITRLNNLTAIGGNVTVTTQPQGNNSTLQASTAYADRAASAITISQIQTINASVASNALTLFGSALSLDFRSNVTGTGTVTRVNGTPANLTIVQNSSLGSVSGTPARFAGLAMNNNGTIELAISNLMGGLQLDESNLINTTAANGTSNNASVVYSAVARSNMPYRVLGVFDSNQSSAGNWSSALTFQQGAGGSQPKIPMQSMVRVNTSNGYGSTNTCVRRFSTVVTNQGSDIVYADSATLGASFTIMASGLYSISYTENYSGAASFCITVNSTQLTTAPNSINTADRAATGYTGAASTSQTVASTLYLSAGAVVRAHGDTTSAGINASAQFTITRIG